MNIAVDIDDTLTNTSEYFQPIVADYFGADLEELRRKGISYANLPEEWKDRRIEFYRQTFDRLVPDTPFKEDAKWGLQTLHDLGHRIIIITARDRSFYEDPEKATLKELENGGVYYDAVYCTRDKLGVCEKENIELLIDDMPHNLNSVASAGVKGLMMRSFVNERMEADFPKVSDWKEVVEFIKGM